MKDDERWHIPESSVVKSHAYRFELFDAGGSNPRLRWFRPDRRMLERRLERGELDGLIARVATEYTTSIPDLTGLGVELYRWLDGPTERWLRAAAAEQHPMLMYVDAEERLRGLPWELLFDEGYLAVHPARPMMPVRAASLRDVGAREAANRPLRVLFMASSPLGVEPVLDFEGEESVILDAAAGRAEVVVEESGSLAGLAERLSWFGPGYFDVLHLSGHGLMESAGPRFVMEDEEGQRADASAEQIAAAARGVWPGLVFVSGCYTAVSSEAALAASEAGLVASMAEALVDAGASAVLGWALPVGDVSASRLAATLYRELGAGAGIAEAVTAARRALFEDRSAYWHLLRLYADRSELGPVVTPLGSPGRVRLRSRAASTLFLDAEGRVKVAARSSFVGRRRELQKLLRVLRPEDPAEGPQIVLLYGMGGQGKSSLAARLLDRIRATHAEHAVWVGRIDQLSVEGLTQRLTLADADVDQEVNELLGRDSIPLADRLRFVLDGPLANTPCVFVFDDFEDGNLEPDGLGGYRCTAEALQVLQAFGTAISRTDSPSRVVITSRYDFPLPAVLQVVRQGISQLQGADLEKKLRLTENLGPTSNIDPAVRERAIAAAAGIPQLLERLDDLVGLDMGDMEALFAAIDATQVDYREELLLLQLLDVQPSAVRRTIALATVYEIAVPLEAILALSPKHPISSDVQAAAGTGLLQAGLHPSTGEVRYLVSPLLRPLLGTERLDSQELRKAQRRGAQFLYQRWGTGDGSSSEIELFEVFRLAEAANEGNIVREIGDRLAYRWLAVSRFREVQALMSRSLRIQSSPRTLLAAGRAQEVTGNLAAALVHYERALSIARELGERADEAAALSGIGDVYDRRGDWRVGLGYYEQALPIQQEVGDRVGEATTLNNIGLVHHRQGEWQAALGYHEQALPIQQEVGDRVGEATTLNNIGGVHNSRGDRQAALSYYEWALSIRREIGDRAGEASTLSNIGGVHYGRGDSGAALGYFEQALPIQREIGDRYGEAAALNNIGLAHDNRGDFQAALDYFEQALRIRREVGDRAGEVVTLYNIAQLHRAAGRLVEAVAQLERVVAMEEAIQHPDLEADTAMLEQVRAELNPKETAGGAEGGESE